jgi:L-aspartate oxidase
VHGANRLASNSLLEGLVFGARAAAAMRDGVGRTPLPSDVVEDAGYASSPHAGRPAVDEVRDLMWRDVGLVRTGAGLADAEGRLRGWQGALARTPPRSMPERRLASLVTVGWLIARAALRREESRGGHFRADFPARDDLHWRRHVADVMAQGFEAHVRHS